MKDKQNILRYCITNFKPVTFFFKLLLIIFNLDLDPILVAEQMTILENRLFCSIAPMELLNKNWSRNEKATFAPNILILTERFNKTSRWVVNEIISRYQLKSRVETLKKFIKMLQVCNDKLFFLIFKKF